MTFTISTGDGSPEKVQESFSDNFREFLLTQQYRSVGTYNVLIKARNNVDEKGAKCTVIVEDPIANLSLEVPPKRIKDGSRVIYIAVGESITIEGEITSGTKVSCSFNFGETILKKDTDVYKATHIYRQTGNYTVSLTCENRVSSAHREYSKRIVVQRDEKMSNLRIVVDVTSKGQNSVFILRKSTGTAFLCNWTLGDGTTFQTDISDIDVPVSHQYAQEGPYDVRVSCINKHGTVEAKTIAWIQIPIVAITCLSLQMYVKTLAEATFNISILSGSHVTLQASFEGNQTQTLSLNDAFNDWKYFIVKHNFTSSGFYEVRITASNRLGVLTTACKPVVITQNPLGNIILISDKTIIKVSNEVTFNLKTSVAEELLPTNASCLWSFGEESQVLKRRLVFNIHGRYTVQHRYLKEGKFVTQVECSNEVSQVFLDTTITVLKPVNPVMKVCLHCDHSTKIEIIASRKYFALGEVATFWLTSQDFDRAYRWKMTDHGDLGITEKPYFSAVLNKTGTFTVSVVVDKVVESSFASVTFIVQEKIAGVSFTSSGFTWLRSATHFKLILPKFKYGDCFVITFRKTFENITDCALSNIDSVSSESSKFELVFNRTFFYEDNFTVCVTVFNKISQEKICLLIEVAKPVCKIESVSIWDSKRQVNGSNEDPIQEIEYNKSQQFQLEGHFINSCLLPDSKDTKLSWQIRRITSGREGVQGGRRKRRSIEDAQLIWESDGSQVVVFALSLEYGKYYFVFTVELTSPDVKNLYGRVVGNAVLKVEIVRSPISGKIAGKRFREVDIEKELRLDAFFYDPDVPQGNGQADLKFDWYCKTHAQPNDPFVHCFDQGKSFDTFPIGSSTVLRTSLKRYVANKTYIFYVKVTKQGDDRTAWDEVTVFILPPGPPEMTIRYERNHLATVATLAFERARFPTLSMLKLFNMHAGD